MSGRSVNLTTLFLSRLRPPKRLTSTSCTYFRHILTTALLEKLKKRKEKRKYVARPDIESEGKCGWIMIIRGGRGGQRVCCPLLNYWGACPPWPPPPPPPLPTPMLPLGSILQGKQLLLKEYIFLSCKI